jgi:two-component system, NtrC family, sensor kinase
MPRSDLPSNPPAGSSRMRIDGGPQLSRTILHYAHHSPTRVDFLRDVSEALLQYFACDALEIRLHEDDLQYCWRATRRPQKDSRLVLMSWWVDEQGRTITSLRDNSDLERLCADVARWEFDADESFFTRNGSFWTGDAWESFFLDHHDDSRMAKNRLCVGGHYRSLGIIRFMTNEKNTGLLHIMSEQPHRFTAKDIEFCEEVAQALGLAAADRFAQAALRERLKELTCLYGIAQVIEDPGITIDQALSRIVELLPPSWQYSDIAAARIVLDNKPCASRGIRPGKYTQSANIFIKGTIRGHVEVTYFEDRPELELGAFLKEEEKLIRAVAREIALFVERRESEEDKKRLGEQLIHADRLATIGQLAAGVAHELNEPLASILGFGQLAGKHNDLPDAAKQDLEKIVNAALYAREVIKNLMVFSRQMPARKNRVSLNQIIEEGLLFLEPRRNNINIRVQRDLAPDLPDIIADPSQLKQVLVNLVVNAMQAMPQGGDLSVSTRRDGEFVVFSVSDNGMGIPEELQDKIFLPFFTTKDVDEGTGLGLAVVHGIVTTHGGSITTESRVGMGTRFDIRLPRQDHDDSQEAIQNDG